MIDQHAEMAVLASIIADNSFLDEVKAILKPSSFGDPKHRLIFDSMREIKEIDEITLGDQLKSNGSLDSAGGYEFLADLGGMVMDKLRYEHVFSYIKIVKEMECKRSLLSLSESTNAKTKGSGRIEEILDDMRRSIDEIELIEKKFTYSLKDVIKVNMDRLEEISKNPTEVTGVRSGFAELDLATSGFQDSDFIVLAARPAMGKTALALNLARNNTGGTLVFSIEMSKEQLVNRLISSESKIAGDKLRNGSLTGTDWDKLVVACDSLIDRKVFINDDPMITIDKIRAESKRAIKRDGINLILVDYIQIIRSTQKVSREQQVAEFARGLKAMAKELNVPVIGLAQLNRGVEERTDKRPMLSDLRESGSIEQEADIVMFLYRDEVYNPDSPDKGFAEIIIGKHRNGSLANIKVKFDGQYTRFTDLQNM